MLYTTSFQVSLKNIDRIMWNKLIGDNNPFLEYDFLRGLEDSHSVGGESGWIPYYILAHNNNKLVGALPLYLKYNSLGEYIFDWQWLGLYKYYNLEYFPKFVIAIPYTPATGNRILVHNEADFSKVFDAMLNQLFSLQKSLKVHSIHWLFTTKEESALLAQKGFCDRLTYQYHWHNREYNTFENFLFALSAKRRNQVLRERRVNKNIEIETLTGDRLKDKHWEAMYSFYLATIDKKWAYPYLTKDFFSYLKNHFQKYTVMFLAKDQEKYLAGALNFRKGNHMYGRYWGALKDFTNLHFELCYYQAIEFCIREKIQLYEAGAQGEYKIKRGFMPSYTYSAHWIEHPILSEAIKDFISESNYNAKLEVQELTNLTPYKRNKK